jgi:hypothetical protein
VTRGEGLLEELLADAPGRCDDRELHGSLHVSVTACYRCVGIFVFSSWCR